MKLPPEALILAYVLGAAPLIAWGMKGSRLARVGFVVLTLLSIVWVLVFWRLGVLQFAPVNLLQFLGILIISPALIIFVTVGYEHHRRSGASPLTPTRQPMDPDLMRRMNPGCLLFIIGGILLLASFFF